MDTTDYVTEGIGKIYDALNSNKSFLRFKTLLKSDAPFITRYPAITIEFDSSSEEWIRLPKVKRLHLTYAVTIYYEEFSEKTRREKVREFLNKICNVLRENYNFGGWALFSDIEDVAPYIIAGGEKLIAGGQIMVTLHKDVKLS